MSDAPNRSAEYQRRYRERQKAKRLDDLKKPEASADVFKSPFFEWAKDDANYSDFELYLALAGIEAPRFDDDSGPTDHALPHAIDGVDNPFPGAENSLARAEVVVGCLIDAAATLAGIINKFKDREISKQIAKIEESDLSDPDERKAALQEIVRLNKLQDQLSKQIRWSFQQWRVTGA
ncbi:hypothetical protein R5H32_05720 [Defluviimonas sp. D31]|uniref:hypothetical protein n=1 Tax=Defluviimonas sp. D31 TaxID=3083253 RepID=UPI00296E9857|nr:hypothetical protein [Defluviimonas sp. D31]MDW4548847.1 hypothetical protein [Defluviimonas sp. D31]